MTLYRFYGNYRLDPLIFKRKMVQKLTKPETNLSRCSLRFKGTSYMNSHTFHAPWAMGTTHWQILLNPEPYFLAIDKYWTDIKRTTYYTVNSDVLEEAVNQLY